MDVFTIDAMTEMLQSPLHFFSYVNRRANYADRLLASQELTILAYHLKQNLWINPEVDLMHLGDDFSAGLDIAMAVRRTGIPGTVTPDGILTRFDAITLGRIVKEIEARPEPVAIDLGFLLLSLSEDTVKDTSRVIDRLAARTRTDGKHHDLTLGFGASGTGLTVHCSNDPVSIAAPRTTGGRSWPLCIAIHSDPKLPSTRSEGSSSSGSVQGKTKRRLETSQDSLARYVAANIRAPSNRNRKKPPGVALALAPAS